MTTKEIRPVRKAVFPVAGMGTRFLPATKAVPKEMLPVGLKPLLYWALDEAAGAGLLRVVLVVNPHKPVVEAAAGLDVDG